MGGGPFSHGLPPYSSSLDLPPFLPFLQAFVTLCHPARCDQIVPEGYVCYCELLQVVTGNYTAIGLDLQIRVGISLCTQYTSCNCTNVYCPVLTALAQNLGLFLPCSPCSVIQALFLPLSPSLPCLHFFLFMCMKLVYLSFIGKGLKSLQSLFLFNFVATSVAFRVIKP